MSFFRAGANRTWFHLLELLVEQPAADAEHVLPLDERQARLSTLAVATEQFLQTATIGEFGARLRLLTTFEAHARAKVTFMVCCGDPQWIVLLCTPAELAFLLKVSAQEASARGCTSSLCTDVRPSLRRLSTLIGRCPQ